MLLLRGGNPTVEPRPGLFGQRSEVVLARSHCVQRRLVLLNNDELAHCEWEAFQLVRCCCCHGRTTRTHLVDKGAFGILDAGKDESRLVLAGFLSWARLKLQKVSAIHVQHLGLHGLRDAAVIIIEGRKSLADFGRRTADYL